MEVVAGLINHIPLLLKVKPCGLSGFAVDKNREIKWKKVQCVHEDGLFWNEIDTKCY